MVSRHVAGGQSDFKVPKNAMVDGFLQVHPTGGHTTNSTFGGILMPQEKKQRIPVWFYPSTIEMIDKAFPDDNRKSRSEFLERAAEFYCGYLSADSAVRFLPLALTSAVSGTVQSSENRIARLLFKLAVEMSMMMNVVAAGADLDDVNLHRLRGKCVDDVKRSIGTVNFDEVLRFQRGE